MTPQVMACACFVGSTSRVQTLDAVLIDTDAGTRGTPADFVARFAELWSNPQLHAPVFGQLLGRRIRLVAPMTPTTTDRESGLHSLRKVFVAVPDLRASVLRWSQADDALFIEMRFTGTIGGRKVSWNNVDRFRFEGGVAVERVAYFDPTVLQRALLRSPSGWVQLLRLFRG
ncbi:MAG: nuclear transport factor 2 family protein [Polyangiales bacterium]